MKPLPLSVSIISGAEAHRIGKTLASVTGWTQEVIVLLNEDVNDGTDEVARKHGAKVFREPWKGYGRQKASAAEKATQPWILSLDADEEVPLPLIREIEQTLTDPRKTDAFAAFEFPRCTQYCNRWIRHGDWYPDHVTRLWRKGSAFWTGIDLHERLEVNGKIGRLKNPLLHFSNENIDRHLEKIGRYSSLFAQQLVEDGRDATWFDLGVRPFWRFLRAYVFRLGFLDGWQGYYIAWWGAFYTITRYTKLREAKTMAQIVAPKTPP